jgi:hypothetical protein
MTNSTITTDIKTICDKQTLSREIQNRTIVKLPVRCALISKTIEISKKQENLSISLDENLGEVLSFKPIIWAKNKLEVIKGTRNLENLSSTFEANNNATIDDLSNVDMDSKWFTSKMIVATTSSTSIFVLTIIIVLIAVFCIKKCKKDKNEIVVKINSHASKNESDMNTCNRVQNADFASDTNDLISDDKAKRVSPQFSKK